MSVKSRGVTVVELVVVLAVAAVLASIGFLTLPRQGMAVEQGQRIFASAVQYGRFEAIKRNGSIEVVFGASSTTITVRDASSGVTLRSFDLDPQGGRVSVKAVAPNAVFVFNARGVATTPIERTVTIGIVGTAAFDRVLAVSGQGSIRRAS